MKLYLPKTLKAYLLAGLTLHAQAATTYDLLEIMDSGYIAPEDANLVLNGKLESTWNNEYNSYDSNYIMWSGKAGASYTLSGSGSFVGAEITAQGILDPETSTYQTVNYEIGKDIVLADCRLWAMYDAKMSFHGSTAEPIKLDNSFNTAWGGTLDLSKANLGSDYATTFVIQGGTLIREKLELGKNFVLESLSYGTWENVSNTFEGNLVLGSGGIIRFGESDSNAGDYTTLHTTTLTVSGDTSIQFYSNYTSYAASAPGVGTVLFTCSSLNNGDKLSELLMWVHGGMDDNYEELPYVQLTDLHLDYTFTNSQYEIKVAAGAPTEPSPDTPDIPDTPDTPDTPDITPPITEGIVSGELSNEPGRNVLLSGSNTVDATQVTNLSNQYIQGDGGILTTTSSQEMLLSGNDTLGYSIKGDGVSSAAKLTIGAEGGHIGDATINLKGTNYESDTINVLSGQMNTAADTTLGTAQSLLSIGSDSASGAADTASVNNFGTIAGDVVVKNLASMDNRGKVMGDVTLAGGAEFANNGTVNGLVTVENGARLQGSGRYQAINVLSGGTMHVGNSPGYSESEDATFGSDSTLSFSVDGTTAATFNHAGEGTHSQLKVTRSLTLNGSPTAAVEITAGILAAGTSPFELTLIDVAPTATLTDNGNTLTLSITSGSNLLEDGTELVQDANGSYILTGKVNVAAAAALLGADGGSIANTLWSSTSAVRSFARSATAQLSAPTATGRDYSVWGSALGDYVSMSGFRSNAHGYAVGADRQFCPHLRAGVAFGQMFGDFTANRGVAEVEQESLMAGLYAEYLRELDKQNSFSITGYVAYGQTENDADTRVGGSAELPGSASWEDETLAVGLRAEWNIRMTDKVTLTPFIGLEYLHGSQDSFTETFAGGSREYRDGSMQVWSLPIGITARTEVTLGEQTLLPELTLAYVGDIARKNPHVRSRVYGLDNCHEGTNPGRSGFMMNVGTQWLITEDWSAGAHYNLETRSHEVSQEASISVRYAF